MVAFAPFHRAAQVRQTVEAWMEQALKDSVRTVTPGSRSLGPNALASPGLLGSADSGGLHGACTQRQCQNPQGLYPKPKLPANTRARGRGHGRSRTQRPDVCPLCQRCQCSHYGIEVRRDRRGSYTPEVLLTPLGLPRPVRPLGLLGFSAIVALVRLFGNGYALNERLRIVLCKWCEKVGPKAQGIPALYTQHSSP